LHSAEVAGGRLVLELEDQLGATVAGRLGDDHGRAGLGDSAAKLLARRPRLLDLCPRPADRDRLADQHRAAHRPALLAQEAALVEVGNCHTPMTLAIANAVR
jgi:hypothetical protein